MDYAAEYIIENHSSAGSITTTTRLPASQVTGTSRHKRTGGLGAVSTETAELTRAGQSMIAVACELGYSGEGNVSVKYRSAPVGTPSRALVEG